MLHFAGVSTGAGAASVVFVASVASAAFAGSAASSGAGRLGSVLVLVGV